MEQSKPESQSIINHTTVTGQHSPPESYDSASTSRRKSLRKRILGTIWDSLDKSPKERKFIAKVDWWILTYVCVAYFVKYLDQTNVCPRCL